VRPFLEAGPPENVTGHDRHVLEVAFTTFVADWAVMRMVQHEPLNHARPEGPGLGIIHGNAHSLGRRSHAGHNNPAARVIFILELLYCALAASTHGVHCRVPTEIGEVKTKRETGAQEVLAIFHLIGLIINEDCNHKIILNMKKHNMDRECTAWLVIYASLCVFAVKYSYFHGHLLSRMCFSKSSLKYLIALWSGSTAPGARAQ